MSFSPRQRPKGFRGGPGPGDLRDLADQKAENKRRQEREKSYCDLFPVGTPVSIRSYEGGLHPEIVKTYGLVVGHRLVGNEAERRMGNSKWRVVVEVRGREVLAAPDKLEKVSLLEVMAAESE